jgi:hypothetical protein
MFAIEWLKQGITVEREAFGLANPADAVEFTRARASVVAARHPREEPDSFRLVDNATGATVVTVKMYDDYSKEPL